MSFEEKIFIALGQISVQIVELQADVKEIKADVRILKEEVSGLKTDMVGVKREQGEMWEMLRWMQENLVTRNEFFAELKPIKQKLAMVY